MPKKVERCVSKVKRSGKSNNSAWAICNASIGSKKKPKRKK